MAKTKINRVALVIEFRLPLLRLLNKLGNAIHLLFACRNQPGRSFGLVNDPRFGAVIHEVNDLGENRRSRAEQLAMLPGTTIVPIAIRFPRPALPARTKNVSLAGKNEVGAN